MADAKSEKQEIKRINAQPVKNSGRSKYVKGDARLHPFTVDVKEYAQSYSLSQNNWAKICMDAQRNGDEPALLIVLGSGQSAVRLWVLGDEMFQEMREAYNEQRVD